MFATSGPAVELWSASRSEPLRNITWGVDTTNCIKFNQVETNVLATTADDRSITLFDVRASSPMRSGSLVSFLQLVSDPCPCSSCGILVWG